MGERPPGRGRQRDRQPRGYTVEVVSGDDQFGLVGQELFFPMVVRVLGPGGAPAGQVQVTFAVSEGGGSLEPDGVPSHAVLSDAQGMAQVRLRLGSDAGPNRVRVEAAGAMLELIARADLPGADIPTSEGCCDAGGPTPAPGMIALALLTGFALRRQTCR